MCTRTLIWLFHKNGRVICNHLVRATTNTVLSRCRYPRDLCRHSVHARALKYRS